MATSFAGTSIRLEDLIANLVTQLQKYCGLPQDCVFETLADESDHIEFPPADRFVLFQPQTFRLAKSIFDGTGRYTPWYDGVVRVACVCRFAQDEEFRNTRELRDKTRAAAALSLKVLDAFSGFTGPSVSYLYKAMSNIDVDVRPKRIKKSAWSVIASTWNVNFVLTLPGGTANP